MAPRSPMARIQDLLNVVSRLTRLEVYDLDTILARMVEAEDKDLDPALRHRVVECCVIRGVLGRAGDRYIYRRQPSPDDIQYLAEAEGVVPEIPTEDLAKHINQLPQMADQLARLQQEVDAMRRGGDDRAAHWLVLNEDLMPPAVLSSLKAKILKVRGHSGLPADTHRMMVHLCSQIISQALKDKT